LARAPGLAGVLWILASCAALSGVSACSRALGPGVDAWQLSLVRYAVGLLVLLPWVWHAGLESVATRHPGLHLRRALVLTAAMYCGFFGFTHLPLADATGLYFSRPLFIVVLSALWLRVAVGRARWLAVGAGFAGMLLVMRPGAGVLQAAALVSAAGALLVAVALLQVKQMQRTEGDLAILVHSNAWGVLLCGAPAAWAWNALGAGQWALLLAAGALGALSQVCMVQAYRRAEPSALAPAEYLQIPFTLALAWALFAEVPPPVVALGIALIAGAGLYTTRLAAGPRAARRGS
jgi:drug/metabolite transporter (DMT)-like permease